MEIEADRYSFSTGAKVSDGNYGSRDVHVSYSSSVKPGETNEQAKKRIFMELNDTFVRFSNHQLKKGTT